MQGLIMLWFLFATIPLIENMELMSLSFFIAMPVFLILVALKEESNVAKNLITKISIRLLEISLIFFLFFFPAISFLHQEKLEENVLHTTHIDYVVQKKIIHNVPESKSIWIAGKTAIPMHKSGYTYEEIIYECYSEDDVLLESFKQGEIKIIDSETQRIEESFKESKKIDHESDLLNIHDELNFLRGECSKEHQEYSHNKTLTKITAFIDRSKLQYSIEYQ